MSEISVTAAGTPPAEGPQEGRRRSLDKNDDVYFTDSFNKYKTRPDDKLGRLSVISLIVNRMIGTGIFEQPSTVLAGCGSLGASLFVWTIGALVAFTGLMVHIEYGLVIPRGMDRYGNWVCFPRSGGEKNYFEFLFRRWDLLPVCVYGVIFVFLGNTAGNSITCSDYLLRMVGVTNPNQHEWLTKGVAVAIITVACLMHTLSRSVGIYAINTLAVIKISILAVIILLSWVARGGHFKSEQVEGPPAWSGLEPANVFNGTPGGIYGWTVAILSALFAFGGYENANYVLSEIKNPKENFPPAAIFGVGLVSVSYILTIIAYYTVIPAVEMLPDIDGRSPKPILLFFAKIFNGNMAAQRAASSLVALSSFGNLMTVTFIAAKVKQEIAKEGIIYPYSIWRKEYNNLWQIISNKFQGDKSVDDENKEKTPIPALVLHWVTSVILITAPPISIVYQLFSRMQAYMIQACFGSILGIGLLYLRYFKPARDPRFRWIPLADDAFQNWNGKLPSFLPQISKWLLRPNPVYPLFYSMCTLFLVVAPWIQHGDSGESRVPQSGTLKWFIFPTVCLCLFPVGVIYWFLYDIILPLPFFLGRRLTRDRRVEVNRADNKDWEGVKAEWVRINTGQADDEEDEDEEDPELPSSNSRAMHVQQSTSV